MNAEKRNIRYGAHTIGFTVVRRDRRTLEIAVEPDATVVVAAPRDAAPDAIDAKVRKRAAWIRRQQRYFMQFLPRTPERRYLAGETHLYLGRQHRLRIEHGEREGVTIGRGIITVATPDPERQERVEALLTGWYRERAHLKFAERLEINIVRFAAFARPRPKGLVIRKMKRRWGSMSAVGRLFLNLRLIEAPTSAIDYVITHELCHLIEPNHGPRFLSLLEQVMPDWPHHKVRLERIMS